MENAVPKALKREIKWELKNYHRTVQKLKTESDPRRRERMERTISVIAQALEDSEPIDRRIAELTLINCSHNPAGAGMIVGYSESEVYRRINRLICKIAVNLRDKGEKKEDA